MAKKLYVGNLSYSVDADTLTAWFSAHGTVESAHIVLDRETGRSRGYGFVEMSTEEEAQEAIQALNESDQDGRQIKVSEANPPKPKDSRGGGGGRRFGGGGGHGGHGGGSGGGFRGGRPGGSGGRPGGRPGGSGGRPGGNRGGSSGGPRRSSY